MPNRFPSSRIALSALLFVLLLNGPALASDDVIASKVTPQAISEGGPSEDADVPAFVKERVNKEEYLRARGEMLSNWMGIEDRFAKGGDVRQRALEEMQRRMDLLGATDPWVALGPNPIPNGQTTGFENSVSGRVSAIAVHPTNEDIVYVGAAQGGVYRSLNGGATWVPLLDSALALSIGSIAISPIDPTVVWVGTGEPSLSADGFFGVGLYRIRNAESATPTIEGPFNQTTLAADAFTGNSVAEIVLHPTDANIMFVGSSTATGGNGGGGLTTTHVRGLFRSTNADGASPTFEKLAPTAFLDRRVTDVIMEPGNPNVLHVAIYGNNTATDGGIWRTANALDSVPTWTKALTFGPARAELAIQKSGSVVTVYAATGEPVPATAPCTGSTQGMLRKSTDGGVSYGAPITAASGFCSFQCFYDIAIDVDPTDANVVHLGGAANSSSSNPCRASIYLRSTNGTSFARSDQGLHADNHSLVVAPSDPNVVYDGNDGGIFRSDDAGVTWTSLNNSTFFGTQFQSVAVHPIHRWFSIGGTQDNGTEMIKPDGTWFQADYGDGGNSAIDSNSVDTENVLMYHTYFNQQNSIIGFARVEQASSATKGGWTFLGRGGVPNGIGNDPVLFYAPITLGPGDPNTVYFGTDRLYRSDDKGDSMTVVSQAPIVSGSRVSHIAVSRLDDNVRMVGLTNGKIFSTTTGSSSLTDITAATMPVKFVGRVAIDPNDKNIGYATFNGYGVAAGQHIWKNSNLAGGAANWTAIGGTMPDVPVNAFVIDPMDSSHLYAGTDIGVWASLNGGATWEPYGTGLPRVAVFDMAIQSPNRKLRIATHGKGMYEISIEGTVTNTSVLTQGAVTVTEGVGDGDEVVEPGETAYLTIQLSNEGNATATDVSVTLSTSTPGVTVTVPTVGYADIAASGSGVNTTAFEVEVGPNAVCGNKIELGIAINYNDPTSPRASSYNFVPGSAMPVSQTNTYAGAPMFIPDPGAGGYASTTITLSNFTSAIADVNFKIGGTSCNTDPGSTTVGLDHTWVGDLQIALQAPSGTYMWLLVGNGGAGTNFCNTTFDDSAPTSINSVTAANAPFTGTFRPAQGTLSMFNGEDPNGVWTIHAYDTGNGDTGTLRAFSLEITEAACTPIVSSVAPTSGGTAGGTNVTITGSGFVNGATVSIGGTPATNVAFVNGTTMTATTAPHAAGASSVSVANTPTQSAALAGAFTYVAPTTVADAYNTPEEVTLTVPAPGVIANDTALSGSVTNAVLVSTTSNGALTLNGNGSFVYVPNPNFSGTDSFTYSANDGTASGAPATVTITVTNFNDSPVANNDSYTTTFATTLNVAAPGVISNDTDADAGTTLVAQLVSGPATGTLTFNTTGGFSYVPNGTVGTVTFRYRLFDGFITSNVATVTITVTEEIPTISSISPNNGPSSGGTVVTVTGTNFHPGSVVSVGNSGPLTTTFNSSTSLTFTTPARPAAALYNVVVNNSATVTATLTNAWMSDFLDVPTGSGFQSFVESIFRFGVTGGCGGGNFCPDNIIPNEQMAVFLLRSKNGNTYTPPGGRTPFDDVTSGPFKPWIEELRFLGITEGCGGNNYCPSAAVTRGSMAPLLLKTEEGGAYVPSTPFQGTFSDVVASNPLAVYIEELYRRSITGGCGNNNYCPTSSLTRGQMAVFLKVTFGLP